MMNSGPPVSPWRSIQLRRTRRIGSCLVLLAFTAWAEEPPDRTSAFEASTEAWRTSTETATLSWADTGGTPAGYLRGTGPAGAEPWHFVTPAIWSGDWSGYRVLKFDFSIPSRHYPDEGQAGMVVIVGANGQEMTWNASTPLWTWTHYEVSLTPAAFGVDQGTFDGIMRDATEVRILAEFSASTEIVGLDNVLLTGTPPEAQGDALIARFTDGSIDGWRPVDDVTLTAESFGRPSLGLKANDWMDGRLYKIATPVSWAGDWRAFQQLEFDMHWTGAAEAHDSVELVRVFGANGGALSWSASLVKDEWTHRSISLLPETFGATPADFEAVMAHVSEMWIFGEFGGSDDITHLDNVILSTEVTGPKQFTQNLVSRFDADDEGWRGYDLSEVTWEEGLGISGGGLKSVDRGNGTARFQSPDAWIGDWRGFGALRFMVRVQANRRADFAGTVEIVTWDGSRLSVQLPEPFHSWTPYTVELAPETFGVTPPEFEAIMEDVACLWLRADLVSGTGAGDTTALDNVLLLTESGPGLPSDHWCDFESGGQGWRYGGWNNSSEAWSFSGLAPHDAVNGNPDGHLENTDTGPWTYWFTPEAWAGDWRGLQSVSFDFKIISGTSLFGTRMISLCSPWGNLHADVVTLPVPGEWVHYELALTPETFGTSAAELEKVLQDVVFLGIRSEWIDGGEREGLDNFRLSKAPDAYWEWISGYYSGSDLTDENKAGKFGNPDGDPPDNWSEYLAGTDPTNPDDYLWLEIVGMSGDTCTLRFNTAHGRVYRLRSLGHLGTGGAWTALPDAIVGTGSPVTVPVAVTEAVGFFRLEAWLAN